MSKENLNVLTEKQQENKKEDKKAFGKFAMALVFAFVIGIGVGMGGIFLKDLFANSSAKEAFL